MPLSPSVCWVSGGRAREPTPHGPCRWEASACGAHHEQVELLLVPGYHLVHRLVIRHLVFFLQDVTRLVWLRGRRGGRRPGSEASGGGPWERSWQSLVRLRWMGTHAAAMRHTRTRTRTLRGVRALCWPSQPRSRGLNGRGD